MSTTPRQAVLDLPNYRAGRAPADDGQLQESLSRLASNESPFGPLPHVARRLAEQISSVNRYPHVRSAPLRAKLADWLDIDVRQVVTGPGSAGLLWYLAEAFLDEHCDMVIPWPSFEGYPVIAQLMGTELRPVPLRDHTVDVAAMCASITERTKMVVIAQPNNPTSTKLSRRSLDVLAAATADRCLLVVDEAYVEFDPSTSMNDTLRLVDSYRHVVVLRTFSKAHGLAGLRIGYAVAPVDVVNVIDRVAPPFSVSSVAQAAAIASLEALDEMNERVVAVNVERTRVLRELRGFISGIPDSFTNFVWIPGGADALELAATLELDGVYTRPVAGHGIRVTIGDPGENDRFLAAIRRAVGPTALRAPDRLDCERIAG